jgi:hypothetical protein
MLGVATLCGLAAVVAPSMVSAAPREYLTQITGFSRPEAVAVTADDEVWVSDVDTGLITKFGPFPSHPTVDVQNGGGIWGGSYQVRSVAENPANDFLYAGNDTEDGAVCGGRPLAVFDNFGDLYHTIVPGGCQMWIAFDTDPEHDNYGNYYLYTGQGPSVIRKYDGYGNPVPFTGSAPYINGNEITGTPKGTFPSGAAGSFSPDFAGIAVDPEGDFWIIDTASREIDEFDESGVLLSRITANSAGVPPNSTPAGSPPFGQFPGLAGLAIDPTNGDILVSDRAGLVVDEFTPQGKFIGQLTGADTPAGSFGYECKSIFGTPSCRTRVTGIAVNSEGYVYVTDGFNQVIDVFAPRSIQPTVEYKSDSNPTETSATLNATVDPNGGGDITFCEFEWGANFNEYKIGKAPCAPDPSGGHFTVPTDVHADVSGLSPETTYHYRLAVSNANGTRIGPDQTFMPHKVLGLRADPATEVTSNSATLNASFVGNGSPTNYWFEYGPTANYGTKAPLPAPPGGSAGSPPGPARTSVQVSLSGLSPVKRYHYRIVAQNGSTSKSLDQSFRTTPLLPQSKGFVTDVHSSQIVLNADINPGGADTVYKFEVGTEKCSLVPNPCSEPYPPAHIGSDLKFHTVSRDLRDLEAGTTYHYRVVTTNSMGTSYGPDRTFSTFPFTAELKDPCENALARQQTEAALLSDCRAYELVSSPHAGGYDVESTLVPGQTPFGGYPLAEGRALYGVHNGAIPGVPGDPTNRGVDPYLATRGDDGWNTSYVGIPANNPSATAPFASTLAEADPALDTFVFGGPDICSPCFPDGSTGMPLHLPGGSLEQGMKGSIAQPGAAADGLVRKHFSADGSHFVFNSSSQFEPDGYNGTGDVSVYDRNLDTGVTQVVSKTPAGANLTCLQGAGACHGPGNDAGISGLDISEDGSRIVIGQKVSTDLEGNDHNHLYMHIGSSPNTVDLTPGTTTGALYAGMSSDGTKVFYSTMDQLAAADTDTSADIYEAQVLGLAPVTPQLVSVGSGGPSNDDTCSPPGAPASWNSAAGGGKCGAVAFAGGGGVAADDGTIYFLSPELLDSAAEADGEADQPNLYVARPGEAPSFVATIDSSAGKPGPQPPSHPRVPGSFVSGLEGPESLAVDQSNGDIYVAERASESVSRYTSAGAPHNFTAGPNAGSNELTGQYLGFGGEGEIAVDNAPGSPLSGSLYIASAIGVRVFDDTGEQLGELSGFGESCGVAVDQSNGTVYVGDYPNHVWRFEPISGATPVENANYVKTGITTEELALCPVGTDSAGHVFAMGYGGGPLKAYEESQFEAAAPAVAGTAVDVSPANRVYTDPSNDDLYVDTGEKIVWMNAAREVIGEIGANELAFSQGVAVNATTKHVYVSTEGEVIEFGYEEAPYAPIDNPAVVNAVQQTGTHSYGDFQVTPSGDYAAFTTRQPLDPNFENFGHSEVYRYDATAPTLECASCPPSNALATGDANLAKDGLSLTDDGRMFFESDEPLVLRDGNERKDVYAWGVEGTGNCESENPNLFPTGRCVSLISTGTSPFDSSLLSASADGIDVFFFTHDTLAHEDENGPVTKLYDARTGGGFFHVPPPALCAASDECHGPGTQAAAPPPIGTIGATPGNHRDERCRKGFVKKRGKCVRKKKRKRKHTRHKRSNRR